MQGGCPTMLFLQLFQFCEGSFNFSLSDLTQPMKQRLFLVGCVLERGLSEIAQGRLQRSDRGLRRGMVYDFCNRYKCAHEHFDATVAVRQQGSGIAEVVRLCS